MKKTNAKKFIRFGFYSAAAAVMLTQSCFAYIDPAATSYIVAIVSGVVVAVGTAFGIIFNKLKRKIKNKEDHEEELTQDFNPEKTRKNRINKAFGFSFYFGTLTATEY